MKDWPRYSRAVENALHVQFNKIIEKEGDEYGY